MRYEPIIKFKDQNSEEGHTNALLFADVMDPPQIRKDERTWPLGHLILSKSSLHQLRNVKRLLSYNQRG